MDDGNSTGRIKDSPGSAIALPKGQKLLLTERTRSGLQVGRQGHLEHNSLPPISQRKVKSEIWKLLADKVKKTENELKNKCIDYGLTVQAEISSESRDWDSFASATQRVEISGFTQSLTDEAKESLQENLAAIVDDRTVKMTYARDSKQGIIATATLSSSEAAQRLLLKTGGTFKFRSAALSVSIFTLKATRPADKRTFVLSGLTDSVKTNVIIAYFSCLLTSSSDNVKVIYRSCDDKVAVIRFERTQCVAKLRDCLLKRPLSKTSSVQLHATLQCNAIQVFNLPYGDDAYLETVCTFLENKEKSAVLDGFKASWSQHVPCLLVTFDDYRDVERALNSLTSIPRLEPVAFRYLDYLGHSVPTEAIVKGNRSRNWPARTVCHVHLPVALEDAWMHYFAVYDKMRRQLADLLLSTHCLTCQWLPAPADRVNSAHEFTLAFILRLQAPPPSSPIVSDCAQNTTNTAWHATLDDPFSLTDWKQHAFKTVQHAISQQFALLCHPVSPLLWTDLLHELDQAGLTRDALNIEHVQLETDGQLATVSARGPAAGVRKLARDLQRLEAKVRCLVQNKQHVVQCVSVKQFERDFLQLDATFTRQMQTGYGVQLSFAQSEGEMELQLTGTADGVNATKLKLNERLKQVKSSGKRLTFDEPCAFLLKNSKRALEAVKTALENEQLRAVWRFASRDHNQIVVYGGSERETARACDILTSIFVVSTRTVSTAQRASLQSAAGNCFLSKVAKYGGHVRMVTENELMTTCVKPLDAKVVSLVEEFLGASSLERHFIAVPAGPLRFLQTFRLQDIERKGNVGTLLLQSKQSGWQLAGSEAQLHAATKDLNELVNSVHTQTMPVQSPLTAKWLRSRAGDLELRKLEKELECIIELKRPDSENSEVGSKVTGKTHIAPGSLQRHKERKSSGGEQRVVQSFVMNGVHLVVASGDALATGSDVLALATDSHLKASSGSVCRSRFFRIAGVKLAEECEDGNAGGASALAHGTVVFTKPAFSTNYRLVAHLVCAADETAVQTCLIKLLDGMNERELQSVLISVDFAHCILAKTVSFYLQQARQSMHLREVRLIAAHEQDARAIADQINQLEALLVQLPNGLRLQLQSGELLQQQVDVLVNTTTSNLDLARGHLSRCFLQKAGRSLQTECNRVLAQHGYVPFGGFACTNSHMQNCRAIFHVVLPPAEHTNACIDDVLRNVVVQMITSCDSLGYLSVAFPALGTGRLSYPVHTVASAMLDAVQCCTQRKSLATVAIVCSENDTDLFNVFKTELQSRCRKKDASHNGRATRQCEVQVVAGDVTQQYDVECMVTCKEDSERPVARPDFKCSSGIDLHYRFVLCIKTPPDAQTCSFLVQQCLQIADGRKCKSIVLPVLAFATSHKEDSLSYALLLAVAQFAREKESSLKLIRIVVPNECSLNFYTELLNKLLVQSECCESDKLTWLQMSETPEFRLQSAVNAEKNTTENDAEAFGEAQLSGGEVALTVTFQTAGTPELVKQRVEQLVSQERLERHLEDDGIGEIESQISALSKQHGVTATVNKLIRKVTLNGLVVDVERTYSAILQELKALQTRKSIQKQMVLLYKSVRWEYELDSSEYSPYSPHSNFAIESAYNNMQPSVQLTLEDDDNYQAKPVVISFTQMTQSDVASGKSVRIKRNDLTKAAATIEPPKSWIPMTPRARVVEVFLTANTLEFDSVQRAFFHSVNGPMSRRILEIRRIQNMELYSKYAVHKRSLLARLKRKEKQIERRLFHGTSEDALESINKYGFNRSYCGKNATAYGNGVYFAVNSGYSAHDMFSRPNNKGEKFMYWSRVLVGDSTLGSPCLIVPPENELTKERFDSVKDEHGELFVIFSDTQAYPEYLIKFI